MSPTPHERRLEQLRRFRNRGEPDLSLGFMGAQFRQEVERPHKQLAKLVAIWQDLVPRELAAATRLVSLQRGVLRVAVDSSPRLYELQQVLRGGLERQIIERHRSTLRSIRLQVDPSFTRS